MRSAFLSLVLSCGLLSPLPANPVPIIFCTDMGNDIDDAMALAMIHSLESRAACELLAVTSSKDHPKSAAFIDATNTFYGRPDVPVGAVRGGATPDGGRFLHLADETGAQGELRYPHDLRDGAEAPDAVTLFRKTLAAQPDRSVTIVQVGFFTNLAQLLDSAPDIHSPLSGYALVGRKVARLVVMAGEFEHHRHREYNIVTDLPSARLVAERWPTPIVWSGFEIGTSVPYPWQSIMEDFEYRDPHLIKEGYLAYTSPEHSRPTWDLTAVLYAAYPERGYFELSPPGSVHLTEDGRTRFAARDGGRDRYLILNPQQAERVRKALVRLTSRPPG